MARSLPPLPSEQGRRSALGGTHHCFTLTSHPRHPSDLVIHRGIETLEGLECSRVFVSDTLRVFLIQANMGLGCSKTLPASETTYIRLSPFPPPRRGSAAALQRAARPDGGDGGVSGRPPSLLALALDALGRSLRLQPQGALLSLPPDLSQLLLEQLVATARLDDECLAQLQGRNFFSLPLRGLAVKPEWLRCLATACLEGVDLGKTSGVRPALPQRPSRPCCPPCYPPDLLSSLLRPGPRQLTPPWLVAGGRRGPGCAGTGCPTAPPALPLPRLLRGLDRLCLVGSARSVAGCIRAPCILQRPLTRCEQCRAVALCPPIRLLQSYRRCSGCRWRAASS